MVSNYSVSDVCNFFWEIEEKLELSSWSIGEVFIWPVVRMNLYYALTRELGIFDDAHPNPRMGRRQRSEAVDSTTASVLSLVMDETTGQERNVQLNESRKFLSRARFLRRSSARDPNTLAHKRLGRGHNGSNPAHNMIEKTSAVIRATRKVDGVEPYTANVARELGEQALILDRPGETRIAKGTVNFDELVRAFRAAYIGNSANSLTEQDEVILGQVQQICQAHLGTGLPQIARRIERAAQVFAAVREGFRRFWEVYRVESIYLTNSYGVSVRAAMAAAQESSINCVELQHGFISKFHLGYSWPNSTYVPYQPNELWCFGDYWHRDAVSLASGVQARTVGSSLLVPWRNRQSGRAPNRIVLFTSQGVIGQMLVEWAVGVARALPDRQVVFRLHPSEALDDYANLEERFGLLPDNFSLSHEHPAILQLISEAQIQIGVFSTTLVEGIALGTSAIVIDLPGSEYMGQIIENGDALLVNSLEDLVRSIDTPISCSNPFHYYSPPVNTLL